MRALVATLSVALLGLACGGRPECSGPGNPYAYPEDPVPIQETTCHRFQVYEAISASLTYPSCGYTVAFGPKGHLMRHADGHLLQADWGEVVATPAECADSHTWGQAWGYRCFNSHCTQGEWERIGQPQSRKGHWNAVSNECSLSLGFTASDADYLTVQVQADAYRGSGTQKVQKRPKGYIYVFEHTGGCLTATPAPPLGHGTP